MVFNYIDLSFQLFPTSSDEAYITHAKYLQSLRRYCDKKASLNPDHSEKIIDVFKEFYHKFDGILKGSLSLVKILEETKFNLNCLLFMVDVESLYHCRMLLNS